MEITETGSVKGDSFRTLDYVVVRCKGQVAKGRAETRPQDFRVEWEIIKTRQEILLGGSYAVTDQ